MSRLVRARARRLGVRLDPSIPRPKRGVAPLPAEVAARSPALLGDSRLFQYLAAAAPGLSELVTIGKVWDLAQLERAHRRRPRTTS